MSKGSTARPLSVPRAKFAEAFDAIFKPKPKPPACCEVNAPAGGCNQGRACKLRQPGQE